jgi:chemotaxis protein methyltransferase CheR
VPGGSDVASVDGASDATPVVAEREFGFTEADFERIRRLIRERAGIALGPAKRNLAYSRVSRLVRAAAADSFHDYLDALEARNNPDELQAFVNALTTNLTSFFREAHHFPVLAKHLRDWPRRETLTIWCSASSTGEEPYSIAMTACEAFDSLAPPVHVVASDIDTGVLATAACGVYPRERVEGISAERLRRFFQRGTGGNAGYVRMRPELQALISFRQVNLLDDSYPIKSAFDVVFCRNVMIYFDKPTQGRILSRFAPLMKPDGRLLAGHSENFLYVSDAFKLRAKTVYQLASARPL